MYLDEQKRKMKGYGSWTGHNLKAIPLMSYESQYRDENLTHLGCPSGFTRILIFHENIHAQQRKKVAKARKARKDWIPCLRCIRYFHIPHNTPCLSPITPPPPPNKKKNCIRTVFSFYWDDCNTQEKWETKVMQNVFFLEGGGEGGGG